MTVEVGQEAPDFELQNQFGTPVRLSSFRGQKNVVLVFFPKAFVTFVSFTAGAAAAAPFAALRRAPSSGRSPR